MLLLGFNAVVADCGGVLLLLPLCRGLCAVAANKRSLREQSLHISPHTPLKAPYGIPAD
jgi:hypothetical protein